MATYKHIRSATANKRPTTSIADGQFAINTNTASPGLFFKDSAGTGIVKVGPVHVGTTAPNSTPAAGGSSGNYLGEQWLDTSVSPAQMKVWNGSAWIGVVADELPVSKLQDGNARQLLQTDAAGTGVEWTSNIDVPGTLDVTGATTLDSTLTVPLGSAAAPTLRFTGDTNTGLYSPGADQVAISTNGTGRLLVDANGNVGIGSAPVSGKGLAVNGNVQFGDGGGFDMNANGSRWQFSLAGTERMRLDSSGRLGLGTSSPSRPLTVNGIIQSESSTLAGGLFYGAYTGTTAGNQLGVLDFYGNGTGVTGEVKITGILDAGSTTSAYLSFNTTSSGTLTEKVRITSDGKVGIGTTSPSEQLEIYSTSDHRLKVSRATTGIELFQPASASPMLNASGTGVALRFGLNDTEAARIDSAGKLLVGTSSSTVNASMVLQGDSGSPTGAAQIYLQRGTAAGSITEGDPLGVINFADSNGGRFARIEGECDGDEASNDYPGRLVFSTTANAASSPTERMRITNDGRVLIGHQSTASSATNSALLTAGSSINTGVGWESYVTTAVTRFHAAFSISGSIVGTISTSGSSTAYNTSSDYRLKENVEPVEGAAARVLQLKPVRFNFIADPDTVVDGFIAHEAQEVVPECVTGEKDAVDDEGNPVYQGIDQSKIVPLLTAALQEALVKIEILEARLTAAGI